jgi:hypothetical protein
VSINCRELRRRYELDGAQQTVQHLSEALRQKHLRADDFSLRDLAEALVPDGREWVSTLDPRRGGVSLLESGDGIDLTAFSHITGQVIYSKIMEGMQNEEFVASKMVETIPTRMDGEKIPGVGALGDVAQVVEPGMPYPSVGFGEDWIETPSTTKRGFIVPVTREAVFFDRTNLVLRNASQVGEALGLNKEKRILDVMIGAVEQVFADLTDPNTGEPILIRGNTLLVPSSLKATAMQIVNATQLRFGDITSGTGTQTVALNPVSSYQIESSRLLKARLTAASIATTTWFAGDFRRAFAYMENWPITVTQSPANSDEDFNKDIVVRFKASERGAAAVIEPRAVVKSTAA